MRLRLLGKIEDEKTKTVLTKLHTSLSGKVSRVLHFKTFHFVCIFPISPSTFLVFVTYMPLRFLVYFFQSLDEFFNHLDAACSSNILGIMLKKPDKKKER